MQKLDKYIFRQLSLIFVFFLFIFTLIFWINKAVSLFDRLIADGHSSSLLFQFALLSLPSTTTTVFPLACFASVIFVTNRLRNDCELTVLQGGSKPVENEQTVFDLRTFRYGNPRGFYNFCCPKYC